MEAMLSVYIYNTLSQTSQNAMSFLLSLCLLFNKIRERAVQVLSGSTEGKEEEERWPKQCIHI
jgi:hypothetical protein